MIQIDIPGFKNLSITDIVMDYNGTLAFDGKLISGLADILNILSKNVHLHVVTADTFGVVAKELKGLPCTLKILGKNNQKEAKRAYIHFLGENGVAAIGNGRNDSLMVKDAALGIVLLQREGAAVETTAQADILCRDSIDALNLFIHPKRLIATLRS